MLRNYIINIIVDTLDQRGDVCKLKTKGEWFFMLLMDNKVKTGGFLDSLTEREKILSSYDDEYIISVVRNLYSSTSTYIIKDLLCELFMEDVPDYVVKKFLEVKDNVKMDEFIDMYKECIGENCFSFLLSF